MANTEFSQQIRQGVNAGPADFAIDTPGCESGNLKGLLNAIVDQISDADRRHTDTLQQMQDRLTGIGREANAIKPRVPGQYAAAFERIEAGMAELANRMTEAASHAPLSAAPVQHVASPVAPVSANGHGFSAPQHSTFAEPPMALRSASDGTGSAVNRLHAGVDTFDVIESSLPGSVSDPWDRDSAEALTGLYETGATTFATKSFALASPAAALKTNDATQAASSGVDHSWLESRFAEIAKRIEESLGELNPDQNFFALGQRVDQLEQHFSTLFEGVATRGDVEGIRLIEAHVGELAEHLERAHNQLQRLDAIESQLAGITDQLDDVHRAALAANDTIDGGSATTSNFDFDTVARAAAEAAAHEFTKFQPRDGAETAEIGSMLRTFIVEQRQGEENTTALLDTLQQAMIRLLDRVDAMELSALQSAQAFAQAPQRVHEAPSEFIHEHQRLAAEQEGAFAGNNIQPSAALDAAVAAVATGRVLPLQSADYSSVTSLGTSAVVDAEPVAKRSPERIRQDFVTEARRAKLRLAEEGNAGSDQQAVRPEALAGSEAPRPTPAVLRASVKTGATGATKKQTSVGGAQRIKVLALSAMLTLGGVWLAKESGLFSSAPLIAASPEADAGSDVAKSADTGPSSVDNPADAASGTLMPSTVTPNDMPVDAAPQGSGDGPKLPEGTRGEILSEEIIVGEASLPMHGVAVDAVQPMTAEGLARARRQQAMASVSGKLGEAAQRNSGTEVTPAALDLSALAGVDPSARAQNNASIAKSEMGQSSALDLPPATVGPLSLRLAAANGDPSAEFEVGARLAEGKGTDQTFKDAAKWYQRSASQGFAQAQYRIGTLYERGLGLKMDVERAKEWYTRAADQGNVKAMHNLAVLSANQSNNTPDYPTAAQWFQKAAEYGLADSQFNLAVLNENGLGVPEDLVAAYKWLSLSAKGGDKEAVRRRDIIKGKLTATQLAEGDKQIATWRAQRANPEVNDARKAGEAWKKNPDNGVNG